MYYVYEARIVYCVCARSHAVTNRIVFAVSSFSSNDLEIIHATRPQCTFDGRENRPIEFVEMLRIEREWKTRVHNLSGDVIYGDISAC